MRAMSVDPAFQLLSTRAIPGTSTGAVQADPAVADPVAPGRAATPGPARDLAFEVAGAELVAALGADDPHRIIEGLADLLYETARAAVERRKPLPWAPRPTPAPDGPRLPSDLRHLTDEAGSLVEAAARSLAANDAGLAAALDAVGRFTHRAAAACGVGLDPFLLDAHRARRDGVERHTAQIARLAGARS